MKNTNPDFENDERHFLYLEYLKILADFTPPVFVMENVQGLLTAKHHGNRIIEKILSDLRNPHQSINSSRKGFGYKLFSFCTPARPEDCEPKDFLVQAEKFGIPQARHRVLILGIRNDIDITPNILRPTPAPMVQQVIGDLPRIRSALSKEEDSLIQWKSVLESIRKENWYITGNMNGFKQTVNEIDEALRIIESENLPLGEDVLKYRKKPKVYEEWYRSDSADIIISHTSRSHMRSDLLRYLFTSSYAAVSKKSASLCDFPESLLPMHKNIQHGVRKGFFSDRFKVQLRDKPSTTITSHIAKDGHYFIHYDPTQCRTLTIREAARLQTFPDSYKFEGTRTSQYRQVGNAVPPLLSLQMAEIIYDILNRIRL
jgi:DNA (cytosine-5)-methyltransferase 1